MTRFLEILKETTYSSAFRNAVLSLGSLWIAGNVKTVENQVALVAILTAFVQSWSSYDKLKAKESTP